MSTVLAKMAVQISANTAEFNKALKDTSGNLKSFTTGIQQIAGSIGIAFGVQQIAAFGLEISKLAGEAKGVEAAFDRLPNSIRLMSELKDATGGTVSELELMKRAVQASNFDISLGALPKLLQFATLRAQQTGQSVDYLVDSIVTGIGRKSKLILDNLGISATQLSAEFNGASLEAQSVADVTEAVGRIAEKALVNMAEFSENASTKLQRLGASWDNLKVSIGKAANESGLLGKTVSGFTRFFDVLSGDELTTGLNGLIAGQKEARKELEAFVEAGGKIDLTWQELMARGFFRSEEAAKKYAKILAEIQQQHENVAPIKTDDQLELEAIAHRYKILREAEEENIITISKLEAEVKKLNDQFVEIDVTKTKELSTNRQLVASYEEQIKALRELGKAAFKSAADIDFLNQKVANGIFNQNASTNNPFLGTQTTPVTGISVPSSQTPSALPDQFKPDEAFEKQLQANESYIKGLEFQATQVKEIMVDMTSVVAGAFVGLGRDLGHALSGAASFGDSFLKIVGDFATQFGEILIGIGVAELALYSSFENPYIAIAAGVALVALGTALSDLKATSPALNPGGGGSSRSSGSTAGTVNGTQNSINIHITGRLEADGNQLIAVIDNTQQANKSRRGG
jgi:hypothetical protein